MSNVTGWNNVTSGKLIEGVFNMYDTNFSGWFIPIIFFTFEILLYTKTRNLTLTWVSGFLFAALYSSTAFMNEFSNYVLFITLSMQLAGILFMLLFRRNQ